MADHNDPNAVNSIFSDIDVSAADLYDIFGFPSDDRAGGDKVVIALTFAAIPQADTLKQGTLGAITGTVSRTGLWAAQTPQVFRRDWLERAHREATEVATDDAALVESLGHPVRLSLGDRLNFKITTATDLALAESWLIQRTAAAGGGA